MSKLKLQYSGHLTQRASSLEKTLMMGKIESRRRRGRQRMKWLDGITDSWIQVCVNSRRQWRTGKPGMLQPMASQRVRHDLTTAQVTWSNQGKSLFLHCSKKCKVKVIFLVFCLFLLKISSNFLVPGDCLFSLF